jgi:hypothetical protein
MQHAIETPSIFAPVSMLPSRTSISCFRRAALHDLRRPQLLVPHGDRPALERAPRALALLSAFEHAEVGQDPKRHRDLLTFVLVGADPAGVEMAGALAILVRSMLLRSPPGRALHAPSSAHARAAGAEIAPPNLFHEPS